MKRLLFVAVLFSALLLSSFSAALAGSSIDKILKKKEILIGTAANIPPLTFKTKDGKLEGLDIDLGRVIAGAMGVNIKTEHIPFEELLPALEKGKIDMIISCMTITPQRNLRVAYVGPYFMSGQSLLITKEIADSIKDRADINKSDFPLAVPIGTTSETIAKIEFPKSNLVVVKTADEGLSLLLQEKVKGVIADYPFCSVAALRYREKGLVSNPPFTMEPIGIAVRADDPLLVNMLQNLLSTLQMNGQLQAMTKRWFENPWWLRELPEERQYF